MYAVELDNVTKTFGQHKAVDGLSLNVPVGSIYGFIGPNGSGKTTTLRMIMRIFAPDGGRVTVLGEADTKAAHDGVTYLPEERMLYKQMKVRDVLQFFARLKRVNPNRAEIDAWLERVGLPGIANQKVETLSKGMTQKVQFIATVISKPKLVLLDEPFSGLDPVNAVVMREMILDLRRQGTTVIFSTHDMSVAEEMCDRIFMIHSGKKVLDGTLAEIQEEYGTDTLHVNVDDASALAMLPDVVNVTDLGNYQELRLSPGADPQAILAALMRQGQVKRFEIARPSLQEIFVRIVSPEKGGARVMA